MLCYALGSMTLVRFPKKLFLIIVIALSILIIPVVKNMHDSKRVELNTDTLADAANKKGVPHENRKNISTTPTAAFGIVSINSPTPTVTSLPAKTPTPTSSLVVNSQTWSIESIDAMKDTKDAVCGRRDDVWINKWLDKAVELGANYVAISTPYDNPTCGDSLSYTKRWVQAIRVHGMHVWHRHMPLSFEGIYNVQKNTSNNFLSQIKDYITANPELFQPGDIVTPIPEPQNGGIQGVNYCANNLCQFSSAANFNQWLRDAMTTVNDAINQIGRGGQLKVGYFGFDGYITWGDNNPDWQGILEDSTVKQMGNITIDHYPELVGDTMANDLQELTAKYPNTPIVIGEWGTVTGGDTVQQIQDDMSAAKNDKNIIGFNYWQFGPSGSGEQLIDDTFSPLSGFAAVQSFYK